MHRSARHVLWLAAALLAGAVSNAHGSIVNGDFSQGLTGWTVSDPFDVTVVNQQAVLAESLVAAETTLSQQFTIAKGSTALEIELVALVTEPQSFFLPDSLAFSLLDPLTGDSLVDTVALSTNFYARDLVDGVDKGEAASGVTLSPDATSLPLKIRLDLTALAASSDVDAELLFELVGGGDSFDASYTIDNVAIRSSGPPPPSTVVPEPGTALVWSGLLLAALCLRRRARR